MEERDYYLGKVSGRHADQRDWVEEHHVEADEDGHADDPVLGVTLADLPRDRPDVTQTQEGPPMTSAGEAILFWVLAPIAVAGLARAASSPARPCTRPSAWP